MASPRERIYRAGGSDGRSGPARLMDAISTAVSPDRKQGRRWDDSPETVARNRRATAARKERERKNRGGK